MISKERNFIALSVVFFTAESKLIANNYTVEATNQHEKTKVRRFIVLLMYMCMYCCTEPHILIIELILFLDFNI